MEVKQMNKKTAAVLTTTQAERTEELAGVLTAISVVSRRLARKLALLEVPPDPGGRPAGKGGGGTNVPRNNQRNPSD
jgi:ATP-dependent Clp protease ATP-binding subunit ClpA